MKLPPSNRRRLLWLMSQLLKRRLEEPTPSGSSPKGESHDPE
jgi:hypothetical protein